MLPGGPELREVALVLQFTWFSNLENGKPDGQLPCAAAVLSAE